MRKITFLSSFFIKVFALLFMTFDHVGLFLQMQYYSEPSLMQLADAFRLVGRFALPLFAFMIVEGVMHTKSFGKYIFRLGIMAALVSLFFIVLEYSGLFTGLGSLLRAGNIFLDLLLLAVTIYCLKHPDWKIKLITLLPLAFSILSFAVKMVENAETIDILWFPAFITLQYDWLTIVLGLGFFVSYYLADLYIKVTEQYTALDKEMWIQNGNYRLLVNIISVVLASIIHFVYYACAYIWPNGVFWDYHMQLYAIISGAFILFYSGKRGYNAKWFQYGSYLYYPLHIIVIFIVYIIVNGGL